jgi:hypothetical protein
MSSAIGAPVSADRLASFSCCERLRKTDVRFMAPQYAGKRTFRSSENSIAVQILCTSEETRGRLKQDCGNSGIFGPSVQKAAPDQREGGRGSDLKVELDGDRTAPNRAFSRKKIF